MSRRTAFLIVTLLSSLSLAQIHLRGMLLIRKESAALVLNPKARSMKSFSVNKELVKNYKSGTKVAVCGQIQTDKFEVQKIRPLGPNEAYFIYSENMEKCGCSDFDKYYESPLSGESIENPGCEPHPESKTH